MEYISREGDEKLVEELKYMENVELPRVREAIAEARDKGDLSENYEYRAAKREQARLLGRIRYKQRVLEYARVVDKTRLHADAVGLLSKVTMTNMTNGMQMTYTLTSTAESNLREGRLSIKSPIAKALIGKRTGDTVQVRVPAGTVTLRVDSIEI